MNTLINREKRSSAIPFAIGLFILFSINTLSCDKNSNPVKSDDKIVELPKRLTGSPYSYSQQPDTLYAIESQRFSEDQLLTIQTLQGLLAQTKPMLYRVQGNGYITWLNDLITNYNIQVDYQFNSDFGGLLQRFKDKIKGYYLCNLGDNSVNVAISLSGLDGAIAATSSVSDILNALNIPLLQDVRGLDEEWVYTNYKDSFNKQSICYQAQSKSTFLSDYAVFGKMLSLYEPINKTITKQVFLEMNDNTALFGWGDSESDLVATASQYSIMVHPADWALNLSTLTNFNAELRQRSHVTDYPIETNVHTVCFLMTDGDNIQWLLNDFSTNQRWYGSPNRSKVKLGWTVSPAMCELAPTILKYFYDEADASDTGRDYFVAGPSGLGYMNPDKYPELISFAELTNQYLAKADLHIVNVIGNSINDTFLSPYLDQDDIDAVFFYYYSNYAGGQGNIKWIHGKPVITGRYNLWDLQNSGYTFQSPSGLADKLNHLSQDIHSKDAYSLIPVHVWTEGVDEVLECVNLLNDHVRVVAPDEFVSLIMKNLNPDQN